MSDMNNAPPLPRGQMPIEEVFRMMWARMNYLENALKESKVNTIDQKIEGNQRYTLGTPSTHSVSAPPSESGQDGVFGTKPITVDQLTNEVPEPSLGSTSQTQHPPHFSSSTTTPFKSPSTYQNITLETSSNDNSEVMEKINLQETRINEIWEAITEMKGEFSELKGEVTEMKGKVTENNYTFNQTIDNISTDLSEMNSKYTQMNNFLMEIQTTQITVNNQILRHYNDNYSEIMESAIEKSAAEKFASKDDTENNGEEGDESGETEQDTTNSTDNVSAKTEHDDVTHETENSKTMSFNIE